MIPHLHTPERLPHESQAEYRFRRYQSQIAARRVRMGEPLPRWPLDKEGEPLPIRYKQESNRRRNLQREVYRELKAASRLRGTWQWQKGEAARRKAEARHAALLSYEYARLEHFHAKHRDQ